MGVSPGADEYSIPFLAQLLHSLPHLNVTFHQVNSSFDPQSPVYLESLGILGSIPAAWLILTLLVLLIYLLTRCCDRKPRPSRSISALKASLAIVSVLCCAAVGLGLYGNDDLHNGIVQLLQQGRQVDLLVSKIRNQTEAIERQLRIQADSQLVQLRDVFDEPVFNISLFKQAFLYLNRSIENNTMAANAAADIRKPLTGLNLAPSIDQGEKYEAIRWPVTMVVLSVLLILCVILLVGVARHSRCALIAFSVCGLLAVIASYLMASVYLASSVALGDLCIAPDKFIEDQGSTELSKTILRYYTSCERARANPFTQRLREAKSTIENMRSNLNLLRQPAIYLYPNKGLDAKLTSLKNEVNSVDTVVTSLMTAVDCRALHIHYLRGARALCNVGMTGLTLMLLSAVLAGLLLTALVWVDSHTWIYIRKKKDYHESNENDPFLPPPQANQAIAARTLQRSQGSFFSSESVPPPSYSSTPPPSYTSALMHNRPHASAPLPPHEAQSLLDGCDMRPSEQYRGSSGSAHMSHLRGKTLGRLPSQHYEPTLPGPNNGKAACKEFPNFKGFKFDQQRAQQQQQQQLPPEQQHRTANIQKFSSLGRRPLPQTPDEKAARKQQHPPIVPKVPSTISQNVETPLNPANFRSLQRGAWQDNAVGANTNTGAFQPTGMQFRSLQRGVNHHHHHHHQPLNHSQFRSAKIQDQAQFNEAVYANSESERQLYAVTEL